MEIHGTVPLDRVATLERVVEDQRILETVVRWAFAEGLRVDDVVTQDEFTHDIVIRLPDGLVLVYDST